MKQSSIIFIIIIVIILLIVGAVWVWQKDTETDGITPKPPTPVEPTEPTTPSEPDSVDVPEGWKTYRNTELGFKLAYPGEWFTYDKVKWDRENINNRCSDTPGVEDPDQILILSREDLGSCVGVIVWEDWPGDLIVREFNSERPGFPYILGRNNVELIEVAGKIASKYPRLENSEGPRKLATRIYINHNGKTYMIEFNQIDIKGNYEPVFDQILSTFQFIN